MGGEGGLQEVVGSLREPDGSARWARCARRAAGGAAGCRKTRCTGRCRRSGSIVLLCPARLRGMFVSVGALRVPTSSTGPSRTPRHRVHRQLDAVGRLRAEGLAEGMTKEQTLNALLVRWLRLTTTSSCWPPPTAPTCLTRHWRPPFRPAYRGAEPQHQRARYIRTSTRTTSRLR